MKYSKYTPNQLEKLRNTVVYLASKISKLSKTKLLKLLYILDEASIKKTGIPFLNLKYKVWKFGPVEDTIYIELSEEISLLKGYIDKRSVFDNNTKKNQEYIVALQPFCDGEFSKNDLQLMDKVVTTFGDKSVSELIEYTHRENSPWYLKAKAENVLELLEDQEINHTDFLVDMEQLVAHDEQKRAIYNDYIEFF